MKEHVHAKLIKAWADGHKIEELLSEKHNIWILTSNPTWSECNSYRIYDPYSNLKEAAKDPTKQIRLRSMDGMGFHSGYKDSGYAWNWTCPPEDYEVRDKPKVKMWRWIYYDSNNNLCLTANYYNKLLPMDSTIVGPAKWTEIEE